jgi:hypothetical protein
MSCVLLSKILFAATRNRMIAQNESDFQPPGGFNHTSLLLVPPNRGQNHQPEAPKLQTQHTLDAQQI